jgi:hypothetical protein
MYADGLHGLYLPAVIALVLFIVVLLLSTYGQKQKNNSREVRRVSIYFREAVLLSLTADSLLLTAEYGQSVG